MRASQNQKNVFVLDDNERKELEKGTYNPKEPVFRLQCHYLVWSEGTIGSKKRDEIVNRTNRKNSCFFFPYDPTMLLPAAEKIFKRKQDKKSNAGQIHPMFGQKGI